MGNALLGDFAVLCPLLENQAGPAGVPRAGAVLQLGECQITLVVEVRVSVGPVLGQRLIGRDAEDPTGFLVQHFLAADVGIVPVEGIERTIRTELHAEADPLGVVGVEQIGSVTGDEARALGCQDIAEHRVLVDVAHEELAMMLGGEGIGEIDARPAMGRAVGVIDDGADVLVDIRVEMPTALTVVDPAGDDVEHVGDHAGGDEEVALGVVVDAPWVAEAVGDDFEAILDRVVAPDAAVDVDGVALELDLLRKGIAVLEKAALALRLADLRWGGKALAAVEPAIRAPVKAVQGLMAIADAPAGQAHLDVVHVRTIVAIAIRDKEQVGRRAEPEAIKADRDGGGEGDALGEDFLLIRDTVPIGVLEDDDAAVARVGKPTLAALVVAVFGDPETSLVIPAEGHWLGDHRLCGKGIHLEAIAHGHGVDGLSGIEEFRLPSFLLGELPQGGRKLPAGVGLPLLGKRGAIVFSDMDQHLVTDGFGLALVDAPVAQSRAAGSNAEFVIHPPGLGVAGVLRVIEDRDAAHVLAPLDLHADVDPDAALALGLPVALSA